MTATDSLSLLSALDNRRLSLIILPTEQCNFRCTYCYEQFDRGRMSLQIVQGIKALIDRRAPTLSTLELGWFGGEPLVAKDIVFEISEYAYGKTLEEGRSHLVGHMTTNGYLLDLLTLTRLIKCGIRSFQVSLDGTGNTHDATRRLGRGFGTFDRIWKNLLTASVSDLPFTIVLRLHLTTFNVLSVRDCVSTLSTAFKGDQRFAVYVKAVEWLGSRSDDKSGTLDRDRAIRIVREVRDQVSQSGLLLHELGDSYVCYASRANSLMIRSDGQLGKCTVALSDDRNAIGQLSADGTLQIDSEKLRPWLRGIVSRNLGELGCPYYGLPVMTRTRKTITTNGREAAQSSHLVELR